MSKLCTPPSLAAFRPRGQDGKIIHEVLDDNQYRLPERFAAHDVLVDVGAHIGSFALACLARGAGEVWCYEPDAENFRLLQENLRGYAEQVLLHQAGVWGGRRPKPRTFSGYPEGNSACGTTLSGVGPNGLHMDIPVATVGFDAILERASQHGTRPVMVKIDCEGAEFPILYDSEHLDWVDALVGEIHEWSPHAVCENTETPWEASRAYSALGLKAFLEGHGFAVELEQVGATQYLFFAQRRE